MHMHMHLKNVRADSGCRWHASHLGMILCAWPGRTAEDRPGCWTSAKAPSASAAPKLNCTTVRVHVSNLSAVARCGWAMHGDASSARVSAQQCPLGRGQVAGRGGCHCAHPHCSRYRSAAPTAATPHPNTWAIYLGVSDLHIIMAAHTMADHKIHFCRGPKCGALRTGRRCRVASALPSFVAMWPLTDCIC